MSVRVGTIGALCVLSLLTGVPAVAGMYSVRDPTYSCLVDVLPASGFTIDPSQPIVGTISTLPLGVRCDFTSDGVAMVVTDSDGVSSAMAGVSALSLVGMGVVAGSLRTGRRA